jgi:hypothetical protein
VFSVLILLLQLIRLWNPVSYQEGRTWIKMLKIGIEDNILIYKGSRECQNSYGTRFEIFTAMKIPVAVFSVTTPRNDAVGYRRFGGLCCLHLHFVLQMEAAWASEMLVSCQNTSRRHNREEIDINRFYLAYFLWWQHNHGCFHSSLAGTSGFPFLLAYDVTRNFMLNL